MSYGLIISEKQYLGEKWVNTYGFITNDTSALPISGSDIELITANLGAFTDGDTDPDGTGYEGGNSIIAAIIGFERIMHAEFIEFTQIYVSDGQRNEGGGLQVFAVFDTSYNGLRSGEDDQYAPGNVTLQVNRNPRGFSARRGRLFYRGVLLAGDVAFGASRLVDFENTAARQKYENLVADALANSLLDQYLQGGSQQGQQDLAIPSYDPNTSEMTGANPMSSLTVRNVVSRQVKRGRRES